MAKQDDKMTIAEMKKKLDDLGESDHPLAGIAAYSSANALVNFHEDGSEDGETIDARDLAMDADEMIAHLASWRFAMHHTAEFANTKMGSRIRNAYYTNLLSVRARVVRVLQILSDRYETRHPQDITWADVSTLGEAGTKLDELIEFLGE